LLGYGGENSVTLEKCIWLVQHWKCWWYQVEFPVGCQYAWSKGQALELEAAAPFPSAGQDLCSPVLSSS